MEEHTLVHSHLIFDYEKKCFFLDNTKNLDKAIRLWPANMKKISKELASIVMEARDAEKESLKIMKQQAELLEKGESIDELGATNPDKSLSCFNVAEWEEVKEDGKIGKFAVKVETLRYKGEIIIWIQFRYHHDDDPPEKMRTRKGQARISVNEDDIKGLRKFVEKCILLEKINKLTKTTTTQN
jgi:hypothetical protein